MINENFVILGALFSFFAGLGYTVGTIKGKIKPNRVTWFLWAFAAFTAFSSEISQGVGLRSLIIFMAGFNPLVIFIVSFVNRKSYWKLGKFDFLCGFFSLLGILLWYLTGVGNMAILFAILADGLAGVPTIVKAYKAPETESYKLFLLWTVGPGITLLTIKNWGFEYYGFPLYILALNSIISIIIRLKISKQK